MQGWFADSGLRRQLFLYNGNVVVFLVWRKDIVDLCFPFLCSQLRMSKFLSLFNNHFTRISHNFPYHFLSRLCALCSKSASAWQLLLGIASCFVRSFRAVSTACSSGEVVYLGWLSDRNMVIDHPRVTARNNEGSRNCPLPAAWFQSFGEHSYKSVSYQP